MTPLADIPSGAVLVSWISLGAGAAPVLAALDAESPLHGKIAQVYLLWRDAEGARDRAVVDATISDIRTRLERRAPDLRDCPWKTTAEVTDHEAIRRFAEVTLRDVRRAHPGAHLLIHLSPGTPAMHAVWLVLGATGFVDDPVVLIQTIPPDKRRIGQPAVERVDVHLDTWLRRARSDRPRPTSTDDDGMLIEPSDLAPDSPLHRVLAELRRWAQLRVPVLLLGERGTGKTTFANHLRAMGPFRKAGAAWPSVVCGQFRGNVTLARSELFGHRRGAFTGADEDRAGLLEKADGDCLFLDEVADVDRDTQRLLMAALEGRGFHRLGDPVARRSRFRLICATNRTSIELRETLDADFLDRISVFVVNIPPLRDCRADIPLLWARILERVVRAAGLSGEAWQALLKERRLLDAIRSSPLDGNFRDLQRAAWHAVAALSDGDDLGGASAAAAAVLTGGRRRMAVPDPGELERLLPLTIPVTDLVESFRNAWVAAALRRGGNQTRAAELLGVPRKTLTGWLPRDD